MVIFIIIRYLSKAELPPLYTKIDIALAKTNRLKVNKSNRCVGCK